MSEQSNQRHRMGNTGMFPIPTGSEFSEADLRVRAGLWPNTIEADTPPPEPEPEPLPKPSLLTICYPQVALNAQVVTGTNMINATIKNLSFGGGNLYAQSNGAQTTASVAYDLGAGNSQAVNYIALRRVNLLTTLNEAGVTIQLIGDDNSSFSSPEVVFDFAGLSTTDLLSGKDLFGYLETPSTAYRYWAVVFTSDAAITMRVGKAYFGELVDFGRAPVNKYDYNYFNSSEAFVSDAGAMFKSQLRNKKRRFQFMWNALTDDQRNSFDANCGQYLDAFQVALYRRAEATHKVLGNDLLVWGYATYSNESGPVVDLNSLPLEFVEDIV